MYLATSESVFPTWKPSLLAFPSHQVQVTEQHQLNTFAFKSLDWRAFAAGLTVLLFSPGRIPGSCWDQGFIFWLQRWKSWPSSVDKVQGLSSDLRLLVQGGRYMTRGSAIVTNTRNQPLFKEKLPFYLYQKRGRPKGKQILMFSKNGYNVISNFRRCSFRTFVLSRELDSILPSLCLQ